MCIIAPLFEIMVKSCAPRAAHGRQIIPTRADLSGHCGHGNKMIRPFKVVWRLENHKTNQTVPFGVKRT